MAQVWLPLSQFNQRLNDPKDVVSLMHLGHTKQRSLFCGQSIQQNQLWTESTRLKKLLPLCGKFLNFICTFAPHRTPPSVNQRPCESLAEQSDRLFETFETRRTKPWCFCCDHSFVVFVPKTLHSESVSPISASICETI